MLKCYIIAKPWWRLTLLLCDMIWLITGRPFTSLLCCYGVCYVVSCLCRQSGSALCCSVPIRMLYGLCIRYTMLWCYNTETETTSREYNNSGSNFTVETRRMKRIRCCISWSVSEHEHELLPWSRMRIALLLYFTAVICSLPLKLMKDETPPTFTQIKIASL